MRYLSFAFPQNIITKALSIRINVLEIYKLRHGATEFNESKFNLLRREFKGKKIEFIAGREFKRM